MQSSEGQGDAFGNKGSSTNSHFAAHRVPGTVLAVLGPTPIIAKWIMSDDKMNSHVGDGAVLGRGDHIFAFVPEDLERFVEDRTQLRKDWAATNATAFVVLDVWLWDTHAFHFK